MDTATCIDFLHVSTFDLEYRLYASLFVWVTLILAGCIYVYAYMQTKSEWKLVLEYTTQKITMLFVCVLSCLTSNAGRAMVSSRSHRTQFTQYETRMFVRMSILVHFLITR